MKYQAIVELGERVWDSIRDTKEQALFRVTEHMKKDHDQKVSRVGDAANWKMIFGENGQLFMEKEGFTVTYKEIK